jgi:peptidoglycan/LPS O-acetylase OafA/YrhL
MAADPSTRPARPRVDALDGLRTFAVGLVICHHWGIGPLYGGYVGVDVFFVLSGFLITGILAGELDRAGRIDGKRYATRRLFRLVPALATLLAAMWIGVALLERLRVMSDELAFNTAGGLLYFHNYAAIFAGDRNFTWATNHFWSLSVEGQFYVLWPIVMAVVWKRFGRSGTFALALTGIVAVNLWRVVLASRGAWGWTYYGLDARGDLLLAGAALALAPVPWREVLQRVTANPVAPIVCVAGIVGVALAAPEGTSASWHVIAAYPFLIVFTVPLVAHLARGTGRVADLFAWAPLAYVGRISYSIYLWHFPIGSFVARNLGWGWGYTWQMVGLSLALTLAVSAASYHLIEIPAQRFGARLLRRTASPR